MSYVFLTSFDNYIDANLCLGQLQEEGINCWLKDEYSVTIDPILTNAIGGIKVMVYESQSARALELLQRQQEPKQAALLCPNCNSKQVERIVSNRKPGNWLRTLATCLLGRYTLAPHKLYHCFDCGTEFPEQNKAAE